MYKHKKEELIEAILVIDMKLLNESLNKLEKSDLEQLSRPDNVIPSNTYSFEFSHYLTILASEMDLVNFYLKGFDKNNMGSQSGLKNHIRNVFMILLDLTDDKKINTNMNSNCEFEKTIVRNFNEEFLNYNENFAALFMSLRSYRNKLSHLDPTTLNPYPPTKIIEFGEELKKLSVVYRKQLDIYMEKSKNPVKKIDDLFGLQTSNKSLYVELFVDVKFNEKSLSDSPPRKKLKENIEEMSTSQYLVLNANIQAEKHEKKTKKLENTIDPTISENSSFFSKAKEKIGAIESLQDTSSKEENLEKPNTFNNTG